MFHKKYSDAKRKYLNLKNLKGGLIDDRFSQKTINVGDTIFIYDPEVENEYKQITIISFHNNNIEFTYINDDGDKITENMDINSMISKYPRDNNGLLFKLSRYKISPTHYIYDTVKYNTAIIMNINNITATRTENELPRLNKLLEQKSIVLPPIDVRINNDKLEIMNGNHRFYYSKYFKYTQIPVIMHFN